MSYNGVVISTFVLPETYARANADNVIAMSSPVVIYDIDAFTAFGQAILQQDTVQFSLSGSATVSSSVAGTTITISDVPFNKTITLPGCGGLKQSAVQEFSLLGACCGVP